MKKKSILSGAAASIGMLVLILDGETALAGARAGLELCIKTVIPSLFPFFVLSLILTSNLTGLTIPLFRPIGKFFHIPKGTESILLSGFLGGYPVGAQCISAAFSENQIDKKTAEYMLSFCNNAGPAFLFGIVSLQFPHIGYTWLLWVIHIASAYLASTWFSNSNNSPALLLKCKDMTLPDALQRAIKIMSSVCGWVVLFRVLLAIISRWVLWMIPLEFQAGIMGLIELANGCCELSSVADLPMRVTICSIMLALGGLCVTMQTISVTKGLSLRNYAGGKFLQSIYSLLLCAGIFGSIWIPVCAILLTILQKLRKNSSFQASLRV